MKYFLFAFINLLLLSSCNRFKINQCAANDKYYYYKQQHVRPPKHYKP